ncbi:MAG TPA: cold shock domain-containing protein [Bradyrhizobium sp.]|nr:cold shock domain-containing protein [Stellaceae bacterium]HUN97971.1 cold shock domain-containing protein [Bradyrhizobium sp.]
MYERRPGFFREDTPSGRRVEAKVKWFNAVKGFGFVTPTDGSQDAFLPMAVLRRAGYEDLREGALVSCEVGAGAKGPLVTSILNVDNRTATLPGSAASGGFDTRAPRLSNTVDGAVKWFEPEKGYGFITPDGGGKDVFIHVTALRRSGVTALDPGQRVRVDVVDGKKGQEAERITLI